MLHSWIPINNGQVVFFHEKPRVGISGNISWSSINIIISIIWPSASISLSLFGLVEPLFTAIICSINPLLLLVLGFASSANVIVECSNAQQKTTAPFWPSYHIHVVGLVVESVWSVGQLCRSPPWTSPVEIVLNISFSKLPCMKKSVFAQWGHCLNKTKLLQTVDILWEILQNILFKKNSAHYIFYVVFLSFFFILLETFVWKPTCPSSL